MKLHNFWRSGTSHRTRIALNLKGLSYEYVAVHLGKEAHLTEAFKAVNPQQLVPALDTGEQVLFIFVIVFFIWSFFHRCFTTNCIFNLF